jgi:alpha-tubulin suppressor-like RCC1 family protein
MTSATSKKPTHITSLLTPFVKFVKVAAGFYSSSAISNDGHLYTWGWSGMCILHSPLSLSNLHLFRSSPYLPVDITRYGRDFVSKW